MSLLPISLISPARGQNGEVIDVPLQQNQETSKEITQEFLKEAAICLAAGLLGHGFTWLVATRRAYKIASLFQTLGYVARSKPSFVTRGLSQALPLVSAPIFATALDGFSKGYSPSEILFFEGWSSYKKYFEIFFWSALGGGASAALTPLLYKTPFLTQSARYVLKGFGANTRVVKELNRGGKAISFLASPVASSLGYGLWERDFDSMGENIAQTGAFYLVLQGGLTLFSRLVLKTSPSFSFKPKGQTRYYLDKKSIEVPNKDFVTLSSLDQAGVVSQARARHLVTNLTDNQYKAIQTLFLKATDKNGQSLWSGIRRTLSQLSGILENEEKKLIKEALVFYAGYNFRAVFQKESLILLDKIRAIVDAPDFIALIRNNFVPK